MSKVFKDVELHKYEADSMSIIERHITNKNPYHSFMNTHLELVDNLEYNVPKGIHNQEVIKNWWNKYVQFYVEDKRVKGLATWDDNYCEECNGFKGPNFPDCCGISLPRSILNLKSLKRLFVSGNRYYGGENQPSDLLPDYIGELKSLETLYLRSFCTKKLADILKKLQNLKILGINEYPLEIPETLKNMNNLEILDLRRCNLKEIPEFIGNLHYLTHLILDDNEIHTLPKTLSNLKSLATISFTNNGMSKFPEIICEITSLKEVYLDHNVKFQLPDNLGKLRHLEVLSLGGTKISSLPDTLAECKDLEVLNLKNCGLTAIPESIVKLKQLKRVTL